MHDDNSANDTARFCSQCGSPRSSGTFCSTCGAKIAPSTTLPSGATQREVAKVDGPQQSAIEESATLSKAYYTEKLSPKPLAMVFLSFLGWLVLPVSLGLFFGSFYLLSRMLAGGGDFGASVATYGSIAIAMLPFWGFFNFVFSFGRLWNIGSGFQRYGIAWLAASISGVPAVIIGLALTPSITGASQSNGLFESVPAFIVWVVSIFAGAGYAISTQDKKRAKHLGIPIEDEKLESRPRQKLLSGPIDLD